MSAKKYPMCEMDDICFRLSCGVGMIAAVHECIEHGDFQEISYADALFGAYDYMSGLVKEMRSVIDSSFSEAREEAGDHEK